MGDRVPVRNLRLIALIFLTIITPVIYAAPAPTNGTEVPSAISCAQQENSSRSVCCRPSKWTDILVFYTSNYFAHAATTRTQPGQSPFGTLCIVGGALLFPMSGALRGARAMVSNAAFADTDLQTAARAGALCMVIKVPTESTKGRSAVVSGLATKLHDRCKLPPGYVLMTVPRDATFADDESASGGAEDGIWKRACSAVSNAVASYSLVAVVQALIAAATLYNSRGHQIDRFGYAAFGLTVVPYLVMSVINLCANLLCPEYSAIYLVSNQALQNLQHQYSPRNLEDTQDKPATQAVAQQDIRLPGPRDLNGVQADQSAQDQTQAQDHHENQAFEISGTVGTLSLESDEDIQKDLSHQIVSATHRNITDLRQLDPGIYERFINLSFLIILFIIIANISIIAGLSHFHEGSSTLAQRIWTMMWLSFGLTIGLIMDGSVETLETRNILNLGPVLAHSKTWENLLEKGLPLILFAVPAIGGLVVVAQMINSYGVCSYV